MPRNAALTTVEAPPAAAPRPRSIVATVEPEFLSSAQAMRLLQVGEGTFRRYRTLPEFPAARFFGPRSPRWRRGELIDFVEQHVASLAKAPKPPEFGMGKGAGRAALEAKKAALRGGRPVAKRDR